MGGPAGHPWMGTFDGGVIRYCDGRFFALTTEDGLPSNRVTRIDEDEEGTVWIFTEGGLAQWKDGELIRVAPAPGSPFNDSLDDPRKYLGMDGKLFGLWRMDASGWRRFAYGRWDGLPLPPHLTDPAKLRIDSIYEDSRGNLWYDLTDRGGEYYLVRDGRLSILRNVHPDSQSFICYQDRQGASGRAVTPSQRVLERRAVHAATGARHGERFQGARGSRRRAVDRHVL